MAFRKHGLVGLFLAGIAAVAAIPSDAKAAVALNKITCNVTQVGWARSSNKLLVICGGNILWTAEASAHSDCGIRLNMDEIKMLQSVATSSNLSGKQVEFWIGTNTNSCNGDQAISDFYLLN